MAAEVSRRLPRPPAGESGGRCRPESASADPGASRLRGRRVCWPSAPRPRTHAGARPGGASPSGERISAHQQMSPGRGGGHRTRVRSCRKVLYEVLLSWAGRGLARASTLIETHLMWGVSSGSFLVPSLRGLRLPAVGGLRLVSWGRPKAGDGPPPDPGWLEWGGAGRRARGPCVVRTPPPQPGTGPLRAPAGALIPECGRGPVGWAHTAGNVGDGGHPARTSAPCRPPGAPGTGCTVCALRVSGSVSGAPTSPGTAHTHVGPQGGGCPLYRCPCAASAPGAPSGGSWGAVLMGDTG